MDTSEWCPTQDKCLDVKYDEETVAEGKGETCSEYVFVKRQYSGICVTGARIVHAVAGNVVPSAQRLMHKDGCLSPFVSCDPK